MQEMEAAGLQSTAEYAGAQLQRASFEIDAAHYHEAERLALTAAETARRKLGATSQPLDDALQILSIAYKNENRPDLSAQYSKQAYEMSLRLHSGNAGDPNVIDAQMGYADALQFAGDLAGAQSQMASAVTRAEHVFGADGMMVGFFLRPLADVERDLGELDAALRHGQRSLDIVMKQSAPPAVAHANRLMTLGRTQLEARHVDAAVSSLAQALELRRTLADAGRKWSVQAVYASAERLAGHSIAAEHLLSDIPLDTDQLSYADRMRVLRELGVLRAREGHRDEALKYFDRALGVKNDQGTDGPKDPIEVALERAETLSEAGVERLAAGDRDGAATSLESALRIFTNRQRAPTPARADALVRLARVRVAQGRTDEARQLLHDAGAFWQQFDAASPWAAETARLQAKVK
jgi:tetratricopeptide (TPR) repeat protein